MMKLEYRKSQIKPLVILNKLVQNNHQRVILNNILCNSPKIYYLIPNLKNQFSLKVGV